MARQFLGAGQLRHRLDIQAATETRDTFGGVVLTWATISTVWGSLEAIGQTPIFVGDQVKGITTYRIIVRYFQGLTSKHRVMYQGRIFDLLSLVVPGERKAFHELLAQEQI